MLGDPNDLSLVLLFPLSFAIAMLLTKYSGAFNKLLGIIAVPAIIMAVIATQSRGGLLGVISVMGIYGYRRIKSKLLLGVIASAGLLFLIAVAGISERASGGAHEEGVDESAMGRLYAWQAAFRMAIVKPLNGVGLDNFYYNYYLYSDFWDGKNHAVHSTWFGVMGETGMVGFISFITMIVLTMLLAYKSMDHLSKLHQQFPADQRIVTFYIAAQGTFSGLVGFCVSGTFLTMGFTWPFYILLGLTVALSQAIKILDNKRRESYAP